LLYEGDNIVDSAFLNEDDNFRFRRTALEAKPYTLVVANRPYMLVLVNGDNVEFSTDLEKNDDEYTVKGSEISSRLQKLSTIRAAFQKSQSEIQAEYERRILSEDEASVQSELMKKNDVIIEQNSKQTFDFAQENRDNLAGFYAMLSLFSLDPITYEKELIGYADEVRVKFPDNSAVQSFANHMAELKPVSIGQKAPDFESLSPTGRKIKLSDFRGKYVLLDFWASWCAPCREENPNIVKQYNAFKDHGFTVLGVSLDDNQTAWLKAIKDDNLDWSQVSELKRWDSETGQLYKITAIPASFLIDPDGVIIGKNLHGLDLENALKARLQ
jgi:peroxiredoxin